MASEGYESREEQLTRQFYEWERRGRGWQTWGQPVGLEPPFRPFWGHFSSPSTGRIDDGRRPGLFSSIFQGFRAQPQTAPVQEEREPGPEYVGNAIPLCELQISLPTDTKVT